MIENIIAIAILVCIVGGIAFYLYKAKKRGETCIGCPCSKKCANKGKCGKNSDN